MTTDRLAAQLDFVIEIDKCKNIFRQTLLTDGNRHENDAEHSWHLAMMAMVLGEYAEGEVDIARVTRMVLIHDLIEIDAGDTFCYDEAAHASKAEREQKAADRIFTILPAEQAERFRALWDEFEARVTPEARFAAALDRFQPLLHNYHTQGAAWQAHGVTADKVLARNAHMRDGSESLWRYAESMIHDAVEKGYLAPAPDTTT